MVKSRLINTCSSILHVLLQEMLAEISAVVASDETEDLQLF